MPKLHGSANSETKRTERRKEEEVYNPQPNSQSKMQKVQKQEYFIKNACYSPAKYYLCKQNNKRSLLGRKQRSQVARSFPNRYQFSCINKVASLFSDRYIFCNYLGVQKLRDGKPLVESTETHRLPSRFIFLVVCSATAVLRILSTVVSPHFFLSYQHPRIIQKNNRPVTLTFAFMSDLSASYDVTIVNNRA